MLWFPSVFSVMLDLMTTDFALLIFLSFSALRVSNHSSAMHISFINLHNFARYHA